MTSNICVNIKMTFNDFSRSNTAPCAWYLSSFFSTKITHKKNTWQNMAMLREDLLETVLVFALLELSSGKQEGSGKQQKNSEWLIDSVSICFKFETFWTTLKISTTLRIKTKHKKIAKQMLYEKNLFDLRKKKVTVYSNFKLTESSQRRRSIV